MVYLVVRVPVHVYRCSSAGNGECMCPCKEPCYDLNFDARGTVKHLAVSWCGHAEHVAKRGRELIFWQSNTTSIYLYLQYLLARDGQRAIATNRVWREHRRLYRNEQPQFSVFRKSFFVPTGKRERERVRGARWEAWPILPLSLGRRPTLPQPPRQSGSQEAPPKLACATSFPAWPQGSWQRPSSTRSTPSRLFCRCVGCCAILSLARNLHGRQTCYHARDRAGLTRCAYCPRRVGRCRARKQTALCLRAMALLVLVAIWRSVMNALPAGRCVRHCCPATTAVSCTSFVSQ